MVSKTCFKVHTQVTLTQTLIDSQWDIAGIITNVSVNPALLNQMADTWQISFQQPRRLSLSS